MSEDEIKNRKMAEREEERKKQLREQQRAREIEQASKKKTNPLKNTWSND
jgi:hypothetical protein